jgi:glycosyltransferase involved in cell wall biosynthesis
VSRLGTVSVVQLVLAHYNYPFYRCLSKRLGGDVCFVVGDRFFGGSPVSVQTEDLWRQDTMNRFVGKQLVYQWRLPRVIFDSKVAVLEFNPRILSNVYVAWWRRRHGLATVWWGHGLSRRTGAGWLSRAARVGLAKQADAVVLYDDRSRQDLVDVGVDPEKLFVARNSIDVDSVARLAKDGIGSERRNVIFVGRLVPDKKIDLLLKAFAIAVVDLPGETDLIIVGDGPDRAQLEACAGTLGLAQRVRFVGELIEEARLAPLFDSSVVFIHPSAIGLAAIHSLAHGVPVLFAEGEEHGPEVEALVPGKNSETFRADDAADLAGLLVQSVAKPDEMRMMGRAGMVAMREAFGVEQMANVFESALAYAARVDSNVPI